MKKHYKILTDIDAGKISIVLKSIIVGLAAGLVTVFYRLVLMKAEKGAQQWYHFVGEHKAYIGITLIGLALCAIIVGWLVKWNPMISGSGIPQLEGIM